MSTRNEIQNVMINSIETIVNNAIKNAGFDKTITGTIIQILGNNQYKVLIQGSERTLSCAVDLDLAVPNIVYITLPQGNYNSAYISGIKR